MTTTPWITHGALWRVALLALLALGAVLASGCLGVGHAGAVTVNITGPADGVWVGNATVNVTGTAGGAAWEEAGLGNAAEFAGGAFANTSISGDAVVLDSIGGGGPSQYQYFQNFTGLEDKIGASDAHWTWIEGALWWDVSTWCCSDDLPVLLHSNTPAEDMSWNTVFPGPISGGTLSFDYFCQMNSWMNIYISTTGLQADETAVLLAAGDIPQRPHTYDLAPIAGGRQIYIRFSAGASSAAYSVCSVDDFSVMVNYTAAPSPSYTFADAFSYGLSAAFANAGYSGGWGISAATSVSDTPPSMVHNQQALGPLRANWAFASTIESAWITFHYQCEASAYVRAYLSPDGAAWTLVMNSPQGAGHTVFSYDATSILGTHSAAYLRFTSDSQFASNRQCGIDDLSITWNMTSIGGAGSYQSPVIDLGAALAIKAVNWSADVPSGSTVNVYFRSSLNNVSFSSWVRIGTSGQVPSPSTGRFVQFQVFMTADTTAPSLSRLWLAFAGISNIDWSLDNATWSPAVASANWSAQVPLQGGLNVITVRAQDSTGASATASVSVRRDTFAPEAPGKPSGPGLSNTSTVVWSWTGSTDVGLGVVRYEVDLGTSAGGSQLGAGISTSLTQLTATGLPEGATVFVRVRAIDGAGIPSPYSESSDGTLIDTSPPGPVDFGAMAARFWGNPFVTWQWLPAPDAASGVDHYLVGIGTSPGSANLGVGLANTTAYTHLGAADGATLYLTVKAVDAAGNVGGAVSSPRTQVDLTGPQGVTILSSPASPTNATTLTWTWSNATDTLSGVDRYDLRFERRGAVPEIFASETDQASASTAASVSGVYTLIVVAVDRVGNAGLEVRTSFVVVDLEAPNPPTVDAVPGFVTQSAFTVSWSQPLDLPSLNASGVAQYRVRVFSEGALQATSTVATNSTSLTMVNGRTYEVRVAAIDHAGNMGAEGSASWFADLRAPSTVGGYGVVVSSPSLPEFTVTWAASSDDGSGVARYRVSIGTTPGGNETLASQEVVGTAFTWAGAFDTRYYVTVTAVDEAGNAAGPSTSAPVMAQRPSDFNLPGGLGLGLVPLLLIAGAAVVFILLRRRRMQGGGDTPGP